MEHLTVGETLKGIRRSHGTAQIGKQPLFTGDLRAMVDSLPPGADDGQAIERIAMPQR